MLSNFSSDVNLQTYNTLGVPARARYFASVKSLEELRNALTTAREQSLPLLILGGGSNLILREDFPGLVLHIDLKGREWLAEDADYRWLRVAAGENWHQIVEYTLNENAWGLENLSLIPGNIGAAPIQNIGAYGVELQSVFAELQALDIHTGQCITFDRAACEFGYRDSIFKGRLRDRYIIVSVTLQLRKVPLLTLDYPALHTELTQYAPQPLTPKLVSQAVCRIRQQKLPDPKTLPNVGSFFKNPIVPRSTWLNLKTQHPGIVGYPVDDQHTKLAAGWLIDHAGWRGHQGPEGVSVHAHQALVLTNPNKANGTAVLALAEQIQVSVKEKYGVLLEPEPRIYP